MTEVTITKQNTFEVIKSVVDETVDIIKRTFGAQGSKVIIQRLTHRIVVDDGVQIARDLHFNDETRNAVLNVIRETAIKTNDREGDGTTGAMIMLQSIINQVAQLGNFNPRKVIRQLEAGLEEVKAELTNKAVPIKTDADLRKVARISYDDKDISEVIAKMYSAVGKDGVVTVENSPTLETFGEVTEGISIKAGFISPYMISNPERIESIVERPYILITDYRLTEAGDVVPIMEKLAGKKINNLVIIADGVETQALATLIVNKMQGSFNAVAINTPRVADKEQYLKDLGLLLGAKVFSGAKGDKVEEATIEDLGRAGRFVSKRDHSTIVDPKGDKKTIKAAVEALKEAIEKEPVSSFKEELVKRYALLTNKIAVIKVGGATEQELRARKYKVEDAVNAVKSALVGGVVCGAGLALARINTSSPILNAALKRPFAQLKENMFLEGYDDLKEDEAINMVTEKRGNFIDVGVMDAANVLIAGVESAVSIASLLLDTTAIIAEKPEEAK